MYCQKCGKEIPQSATLCESCGEELPLPSEKKENNNASKTNYLAITALIFSLPPIGLMCGFGLIGFTFSICGLRFAKKNGGVGRGLSFAALIISGFWVLMLVFMFLLLMLINVIS